MWNTWREAVSLHVLRLLRLSGESNYATIHYLLQCSRCLPQERMAINIKLVTVQYRWEYDKIVAVDVGENG